MRVACAEEEASGVTLRDGVDTDADAYPDADAYMDADVDADAHVTCDINPTNEYSSASERDGDTAAKCSAQPMATDPFPKGSSGRKKKLTHLSKPVPPAPTDDGTAPVGTLSNLCVNSAPSGCTQKAEDEDMSSLSSGMTMRPLCQWATTPASRGQALGPPTMGGARPRPIFTGNPHAGQMLPGMARPGWSGPLPSALPPAVGWTGPCVQPLALSQPPTSLQPPTLSQPLTTLPPCSLSQLPPSVPKAPGSCVGSYVSSVYEMDD